MISYAVASQHNLHIKAKLLVYNDCTTKWEAIIIILVYPVPWIICKQSKQSLAWQCGILCKIVSILLTSSACRLRQFVLHIDACTRLLGLIYSCTDCLLKLMTTFFRDIWFIDGSCRITECKETGLLMLVSACICNGLAICYSPLEPIHSWPSNKVTII